MDTRLIELPNGLRVLYQYAPYTRAVHCGYVINLGSRDDRPEEAGMAHFVEHMVFKGTAKRKTYHVINYLESVGGDVNAYTTKEKTCLYASLGAEYLDRATELLTDIAFRSTFPEKEIFKEQQVIAEEIDMYRNTPDEAILEDFDQMIFPGHTLGHPILGTRDTIGTFTQARLLEHTRQGYAQGRIVYFIAGNVTEKDVRRVIGKHLLPLELPPDTLAREAPAAGIELNQQVRIPTEQAHEILGGRAFAAGHPFHTPFQLLNNLLGGPAMNSRLNLNIRERYGLTYNINTFYAPFADSGSWGVYYACDPDNLARIRGLVQRELRQCVRAPLGSVGFHQAQRQLIGQFTLSYEHLLNQMLVAANDLLDFGTCYSYEEQVAEIESTTAAQVQEAAALLFHEQEQALITYLPEDA
ncbi:MAG: pitrilysin family protein [Bacteroidia bacterium]|nr:pitrilysin family protein [Bacteroidia bacterium]